MAESVPNPRQRTNIGPRLDWALSKNNTLTARYQYYRDTETNDGDRPDSPCLRRPTTHHRPNRPFRSATRKSSARRS